MINFKKILFPVDLSAQSRAVAPSVAAMARRFGSEVTLLHVTSETAPESELDHFAADAFSGIPIARELLEGDPAHQIGRYADEHKIDLIMMPTHGHGAFRALFLGSVTAKVLRDTHCPVWTSVHAEELSSHSPDRWKRILCAVEIDERGESALKWAAPDVHRKWSDPPMRRLTLTRRPYSYSKWAGLRRSRPPRQHRSLVRHLRRRSPLLRKRPKRRTTKRR